MILGCRITRGPNWVLILVHDEEGHAKYDTKPFLRRIGSICVDLMWLLVVLLIGETAQIDEIVPLPGQFSIQSAQGGCGGRRIPFYSCQLVFSSISLDVALAPSHWMRANMSTSGPIASPTPPLSHTNYRPVQLKLLLFVSPPPRLPLPRSPPSSKRESEVFLMRPT